MGNAVINRLFLFFITVLILLAGRITSGLLLIIALFLLFFKIVILPVISYLLKGKDKQNLYVKPSNELFYALSLIILYLLFYQKPIYLITGWGIMGFGNFFTETIFSSGNRFFSHYPKVKRILTVLTFSVAGVIGTGFLLTFIHPRIFLDQPLIFWWIVIIPAAIIAGQFREIEGLIHPYFITGIVAGLTTWLTAEVILHGSLYLPVNIWTGGGIVVIFVVLSYLSGKIDLKGSIAGGLIALGLFLGGGWGSLGLLFIFFVAGTFVSSWKKEEKKALKLEQENEGKRSINNALSNGGIAGLLGFLAWIFPQYETVFLPMLAASLAAAASDTFSSELGNVYGKTYRNILTFSKDERGKDGVISLEGSLLGLLGSGIIALIYGLWFGQYAQAIVIFAAGYGGNLMDSFLGATLQKHGYMNNDTVNVGCTLFAALWLLAVSFWPLAFGIFSG